MNTLFHWYLIVVWLTGFYPVTSPFVSVSQVKFKFFHAVTLLSLLWAFLPLFVAFDDLKEGNEKSRLDPNNSVSTSIIRYTILFSKYLVNFFLRISSVVHCNDLIDIVQFLVTSKTFTRYNIKWDTFKYLVILSLVSLMVMAMDFQALWAIGMSSSSSGFKSSTQNGSENGTITMEPEQVYEYVILPEDETFRKMIVVLVEWYCKIAPLVSLGYIIVIGLYLLELHQDTCMELAMKFYTLHPSNLKIMMEHELSSIGLHYYTNLHPLGINLGAFGFGGSAVGPTDPDGDGLSENDKSSKKLQQDMDIFFIAGKGKPMDFDEFSEKFKSLKSCFGKYGETAGIFSLLILVNSSAFIIESVGKLAFDGGQGVEEKFRNVFVALFFIFMVAHFGDYMSAKMDENRDELRNAMGHFGYKGESKLEKVSSWVIDWQWNLTAKNLFEMNHSVIPANLGTIMTYFIFIFQLKMSEDEKKRKGAQ